MIKSLSFCILAVNKTDEALDRCLASVRRQKVPDCEILIGGVNKVTGGGLTYLYRAEWSSSMPCLANEIRNEFCKRATKDFLVLIDADVELAPDWFEHMRAADCFDVAGSSLTGRGGSRIIDWAYLLTLGERCLPLPLDYDEWAPGAYVNGALMVLRRSVWDAVEFDEDRRLGQNDDADFCRRASEEGFRIGVFPKAKAHCHDENAAVSCGQTNFEASVVVAKELREALFNAWNAYQQKNYPEAIRLYEIVTAIDPARSQAWGKIGWAKYFGAAYPEALRAFDKALELDAENHEALRGRGWAHHQTQRHEAAIGDFTEALKRLGNANRDLVQETLRGRGWSRYHRGLWEQALEDFSETLNHTDPANKGILQDVLRGCGWSFYQTKDFEEAAKAFEKALQCIDAGDHGVAKDARNGLESARKAMAQGGAAAAPAYAQALADVRRKSDEGSGIVGRVKAKLKDLLSSS